MIEISFIIIKNQKILTKYIGPKSKMMLSTFTFNLLFDYQCFVRFDLAERWDHQKQVFPCFFFFFQWCPLFKSQTKRRIQSARKGRDELPVYLHQSGYLGGNSNADCVLYTNRPQLSKQADTGFMLLSSCRSILTSIPKTTSLRTSLSPPSAALMLLRGQSTASWQRTLSPGFWGQKCTRNW